jgi:hypothetical protein
MQGHRSNFLRKKKAGIVCRIPRPIANSGFNAFMSRIFFRVVSFTCSKPFLPAEKEGEGQVCKAAENYEANAFGRIKQNS